MAAGDSVAEKGAEVEVESVARVSQELQSDRVSQ